MTGDLPRGDGDAAIDALIGRDGRLRTVVERFGRPGTKRRPGGYATLVLLILEQRVSLASARATYDRLARAAGRVAPEPVNRLSDERFRAAGVSRQKTGYIRLLGESVLDRSLALDRLPDLDDGSVREALMRIKGIGRWTADVYLLACLGRPDIWPVGDVALQAAAARVLELPSRPGQAELEEIGEVWRPFRSAAARILWHHYLCTVRMRAT